MCDFVRNLFVLLLCENYGFDDDDYDIVFVICVFVVTLSRVIVERFRVRRSFLSIIVE